MKKILNFLVLTAFVVCISTSSRGQAQRTGGPDRDYIQKKANSETNATGRSNSVLLVPPPSNDNCANAIPITVDGGCVTGTTNGATTQGGDVHGCMTIGDNSVWYSFFTGASTTLNLSFIYTNAPYCGPGIAVWGPFSTATGHCFTGGSPLCLVQNLGDPGYHQQMTGLSPNSYYLIQIVGYDAACWGFAIGDYTNFCIGINTPPSNDLIANAATMNQCGFAYSGTNIGYSQQGCGLRFSDLDCNLGTTNCGGATTGDNTQYVINDEAWWKFCSTQACSWTVTFNNINSCTLSPPNQGLQMTIFRGSPTNLQCVQSDPNNPQTVGTSWTSAAFATAPGECIYIVVDGFAGDNCNFSFTLNSSAGCCAVLPIQLIDFEVAKKGRTALLSWATATETNNDYFRVEKSTDGINFAEVTTVKGKGNSTGTTYYSSKDINLTRGYSYYRLKQVDYNGNFTYSETKMLKDEGVTAFQVTPDVDSRLVNISFNSELRSNSRISLYDFSGRLLSSSAVECIEGYNLFKYDLGNVSTGMYFIVMEVNGEIQKSRFFKD